ncbi:hypothetical protein [Sphingomonas albertensis]|uniref:DUF4259 domain-containing protein n=1 Tax=Sphingomonas albertensis TaxID=2762591 RepID=A0ABR7AS87_9SPHN|nr:hypothetical protein [Sphingomonas albertensis]MBC3943330.1 hypothetical protein [Sphingomonas albertensis]
MSAHQKLTPQPAQDVTAKHTPGPWTIIPAVPYDGDDDELVGAFNEPAGIEGADGSPVCVFGTCEGSGTLFENEADYRLIAAAPDLLAALTSALPAVATLWTTAGYDGDAEFEGTLKSILDAIDAAIAKATAA